VAALALAPGRLVAVAGGRASFLRALWDALAGARVTTSPGQMERPDLVLWWPRADEPLDVLAELGNRLAPAGRVWALLEAESQTDAISRVERLRAIAR
jgi:hypothetical protein